MPLETATTIAQLDSSWPLSGDPINQGDDHLRLLKSVLALQFPGVDGNGYKETIITNETELNYSSGLTGNIQDQIDNILVGIDQLEVEIEFQLSAPAGTRLLIVSTVVPVGWSQVTTGVDDRYLRISNSSPGDTGGNFNWASGFTVGVDVDAHVLLEAEIPSHFHEYVAPTEPENSDYEPSEWPAFSARGPSGIWDNKLGSGGGGGRGKSMTTKDAGGNTGHTHTSTDTSSSNTGFRPSYLDSIVIEKES